MFGFHTFHHNPEESIASVLAEEPPRVAGRGTGYNAGARPYGDGEDDFLRPETVTQSPPRVWFQK